MYILSQYGLGIVVGLLMVCGDGKLSSKLHVVCVMFSVYVCVSVSVCVCVCAHDC